MIGEHLLLTEKYRPKRVSDCVLPSTIQSTFKGFVRDGALPNLLLTGPPGTGKTTVLKAALDELDAEYFFVNGSLNRNIDTLRVEISQFASTVSFTKRRKYVLIDEADYLNPNSTQPSLRAFMEEFARNCGFLLTGNYKNRIIEPLRSRLAGIEFQIPQDEETHIQAALLKRLIEITKAEDIKADVKVLAEIVRLYFPDFRRILNEVQRSAAATGEVIGLTRSSTRIDALIEHLKEKNWMMMRRWVGENSDVDAKELFHELSEIGQHEMTPSSLPQLFVTLNEYDYRDAFVADHEINIVACLTQIMSDAVWK